MGSKQLRDGALADPAVIRFINKNLIPVWVNIRNHAWPDWPAIDGVDSLVLNQFREVTNTFYYFYFARSYVVSPNLETLLNEEEGVFGHIERKAKPYLQMIRYSVNRHKMASGA